MNLSKSTLLSVENIHTFYGQSHILQGTSLEVKPHECIALLGRNGAGKTTTLRSIMGLAPPQEGRIYFKGQEIHRLKPFQISSIGIALVPEDRQVFSTLTVEENLYIGFQKDKSKDGWNIERVFDEFPSLAERRHNRGHQLSGGEQQMLTIARALMTNPDLLLLDEPSEGLSPLVVEKVFKIIHEIKTEGLPIVLVEQNVQATKSVANHYYIIEQGQNVFTGSHMEFWSQPQLQEKYLGV